MLQKTIKFIDLFAGMGGTRIGFEAACKELNLIPKCVFTSEIKKHAIKIYEQNFNDSEIFGDISQVHTNDIPDFDVLLAGFPCQPFSSAGSRLGFVDTRGTLFFEIERILKSKRPKFFLLENVEGLVSHDKEKKSDKIGKTLKTILIHLKAVGYDVDWKMLDSYDFGIPQKRKRVYILGNRDDSICIPDFPKPHKPLNQFLESGIYETQGEFEKLIFSHFKPKELYGKQIKDKRGGKNNIHSWDIELKGPTTETQREILSILLKIRRYKKWATQKGIVWMDGMPLTIDEIHSELEQIKFKFINKKDLKKLLDDLVDKGYLKFEYPKDQIKIIHEDGSSYTKRQHRTDLDKGYNIVAGKLSFKISKILDPQGFSPTLVATDIDRLAVVDGEILRKLTKRECLRISSFPDWYNANMVTRKELFDLIGNTVMVSVIKDLSEVLLERTLNTHKTLVATISSST